MPTPRFLAGRAGITGGGCFPGNRKGIRPASLFREGKGSIIEKKAQYDGKRRGENQDEREKLPKALFHGIAPLGGK